MTNGDLDIIRAASARLGRLMTGPRLYEDIRRRAGVQLDKFSEILLNAMAEDEAADLRLSDIANRLGIELSSVSRKVQKLSDAGLVARGTDPDDARATRLTITAAGRDSLTRVRQARSDVLAEALASWSDDDRRTFGTLFARFTDDLDRYFHDEER